jgi:hypothetical protein
MQAPVLREFAPGKRVIMYYYRIPGNAYPYLMKKIFMAMGFVL